jgi:hypothetical protein
VRKFQITETSCYHVEAESEEAAMEKFLADKDRDRHFFVAVEDRSVEEIADDGGPV